MSREALSYKGTKRKEVGRGVGEDHSTEEVVPTNKLGAIKHGSIYLVRYADDMMILAQRNVKKGITLLERYVQRLGLRLNHEKTRTVHMTQRTCVDFLGFRFLYTTNRNTHSCLLVVFLS